MSDGRLPIGAGTPEGEAIAVVRAWVEQSVPGAWRDAAQAGRALREVRSFEEYEDWYPAFAASGLVVPTWPVAYGGLDLPPALARRIERELAPYRLGRLNPLGLNLCASALFAYGSEEQRLRFLPRIVDNSEKWCQLFSEPGAGSDLASLACRAERDGEGWVLNGQKVWTTWAHRSDWGVCLARTNPDLPKRQGITYFLVDLRTPGVTVRPLRDMTGNVDFNEVYLDGVPVPDSQRVGAEGEGWKVAGATLSAERQMVAGAGSGGVDRIGGSGVEAVIELARRTGRHRDPVVRQQVVRLLSEERIRAWTNARVRAELRAGRTPGAHSSVGKVHQGDLNQRLQLVACDLLGAGALAWEGERPPSEVHGMLRSRANSIEGGTTEVNKNVVGERVLGLPREPDPYRSVSWNEVPRS